LDPKGQAAGLEEAGGVSDVGVPDQVASAVGWRYPRGGQLVQGAVGESQGPGAGGQLSEAAGDGAHGADPAGGRDLSRTQKSRAAYDKAIELAGNTAETAYLTRRRDQLG
jgi:hypothetical protein